MIASQNLQNEPNASAAAAMQTAIETVIRTRRTAQHFRPDPIGADILPWALELARWAPNHKLTEPWRVRSLSAPTRDRMIEINTRLTLEKSGEEAAKQKQASWSAIPGWLYVTCEIHSDQFRHEEDYAACCCFVQNLLLALWSRGIGSKWATGPIARHPLVQSLLNVDPARERIVGLVWYGYAEVASTPSRRPLEEWLRVV